MSSINIKVVFVGAICFVLWGGYNIAKASYTAINWEKAEGTVIDFERNTWSCGKNIGKCFALIVGYNTDKGSFTVISDKKFNYTKPTHLLKDTVVVYYSPTNHADATLGGSYGPMGRGIIVLIVGLVVLFIYWVVSKRNA